MDQTKNMQTVIEGPELLGSRLASLACTYSNVHTVTIYKKIYKRDSQTTQPDKQKTDIHSDKQTDN